MILSAENWAGVHCQLFSSRYLVLILREEIDTTGLHFSDYFENRHNYHSRVQANAHFMHIIYVTADPCTNRLSSGPAHITYLTSIGPMAEIVIFWCSAYEGEIGIQRIMRTLA